MMKRWNWSTLRSEISEKAPTSSSAKVTAGKGLVTRC
ncbi:MAG: hypothetical protein ACI89X_001665 [Planctomycetota bacterium]|jgi:hypothetical protein